MSPKLKAALVGAIVAIVVGFAASQGLISQQTAEEIKAKTNEVLSEEPAPAPTQTPQPKTNEPQPQVEQQ
ncbi:hypothetical protein F9K79_17850 [Ochrobactrum sp. Kaboul]|nr:hypothetical protein F9K79_17850 [Ochrobactrum sp. Kaboul]